MFLINVFLIFLIAFSLFTRLLHYTFNTSKPRTALRMGENGGFVPEIRKSAVQAKKKQ